jgi:hypothetical protein
MRNDSYLMTNDKSAPFVADRGLEPGTPGTPNPGVKLISKSMQDAL